MDQPHALTAVIIALVVAGCGGGAPNVEGQVGEAQHAINMYCLDGQADGAKAVAALTKVAREHPDAKPFGDSMKVVLADAANAVDCDPQLAAELDRVRDSL